LSRRNVIVAIASLFASPASADVAPINIEPEKTVEPLLDVSKRVPDIVLDIRYATPNNFAKVAVYPAAKCLLRKSVSDRLGLVQKELKAMGLGLKVWDCYRPFSVQERFWQLVPDEKYVGRPIRNAKGRPVEGSKHNRGAAIDLTLVDRRGQELSMPTDYDDFSERAHRTFLGVTPEQAFHSALLEVVMRKQGFIPFATEWWHFDGPGWQRYPLSDEPLTARSPAN
jgi:beta-N-acetylhexosaminidase/D-alanyl-D-alanine dipeptidase